MFWLHRGWAYHHQAMLAPPTTWERDWEWRYKRDSAGNPIEFIDQAEVNSLNNRAISDINNALVLDPNYQIAWHNRGWFFLNIGNYHQSIEDSSHALILDSTHPGTWNNRGVAYRRLRKWKEAIQDFDRALSLDPSHQLAINNKREAVGSRRFGRIKRGVVIAAVVVAVFLIAVYSV